ncbi:uncharacterized protein THITE_2107532 [Thermothielavioides terrestris NRRL 8126]|uniref:Uncharacterized protein n=1 Tax=Thermothielavioides terrestris (strain ATCC 38088 / NRRL 8126) TaxID=578455 RepID=G2QU84_THETT|nr:uncharacterized protein THITE_2107532 [Thermothielavioides terrestris NRRL 8126]AEO62836.1 hypothetical protein THITE_2107532 [Thermothielavioides terrestris NRRL 8126]
MSSGAGRESRKGSLGSASSGIDSSRERQTVGTLLASIATCMTDALRILMFADKRHWGPDEFEQTRALEQALDEAKKDFQEMAPLVRGQFYYENDRTPESLHELLVLLTKFEFHTQNFRDWARQGGPINPAWARETAQLRRELHRAQCRAARRIFAAAQLDAAGGERCLGAVLVHRQQARIEAERGRRSRRDRDGIPPWQAQQRQRQRQRGREEEEDEEEAVAVAGRAAGDSLDSEPGRTSASGRRGSLEELVPSCNAVGRFLRLGATHDAAFVCDFCEGHIVWPDLESMPSERTPLPPTAVTGYPHWQAKGVSAATGEEKTIVFAPLAIANHMPPEPGDWQAGLLCPYCEEDTYVDEGEDSSELRYVQDERGFPDLEKFREHLEWYHTALPIPPISALASALPSAASSCRVM